MNEAVKATNISTGAQPILEIENLSISFFTRRGEIPAVMDFSCTVMPGEAMGIVGECGCGKSTVSLGIMRDLSNVGKIVGGRIKFQGKDMGDMSDEELRQIRGNKIAMIYQEPMASLNPALKIGQQLMEVPLIHEKVSKDEAYKRSLEMVRAVRLPDPERMMRSYPHQLSGGQQQRIVIAMALLSKPALLLLDEPTTALDVTVEAGIVELVKGLGKQFGTSMIFVSHNLGLILETCDRITVMYSGEAVETGTVKDVFDRMRHPYTQGLFRSIPLPGADKNSRPLISIPGQLPLPHERPKGCNFGPRCQHFVKGVCDAAEIPMIPVVGHDNHASRCVRFEEIDWAALPEGAKKKKEPITPGAPVLKIDDLRKYYKVSANEIFGGSEGRVVKANETISFEARESETVAIVGESGCGKSTLAKVLLGLETASAGTVTLGNTEIQSTPIEKRDVDDYLVDPDGVPEPVRHAQSEPHRRLADHPHAGEIQGRQHAGRTPAEDARTARPGEASARFRDPQAAPAFRWPEAAHRRGARLRRPRQGGGGRRAGFGTRRLGSGGGDRTSDGHPARIQDDDVVHQPRSLGGALHRRPRRRHVSRLHRRTGHDRPDFLAALPSLYRGAAVGDPDRRYFAWSRSTSCWKATFLRR